MKTLRAKLEITVNYYTEIQNALFWHRSFMSRTREKNKYATDDEYKSVLVHWHERANEAKEYRDEHLVKARKLKEKLEALK